jgi:hypothetical protein
MTEAVTAYAVLSVRDPYAQDHNASLEISIQEETFKLYWPRVELITTGFGNKTIGYHLIYKVRHL